MKKILVLGHIREEGFAQLDVRADVSYEHLTECDERTLRDRVQGVHAIAVRTAPLSEKVLARAPELEIVSRHGVGYDNVPIETLTARNIPLALAVNANAISVAEHTMYFILALAKRGPSYDEATRSGNFAFRNSYLATDISAKTLLLVGFGRIGSRVAARARAFDMKVQAFDPYVSGERMEELGVERVSDLERALGGADYVSVHCPLNERTHHLIGAKELQRMPVSSYIVNCARGGIVDEEALRTALLRHEIAGAGLDVFEHEPVSASHRLFEHTNVIVSPHSAGVSAEAAVRMSEETIANVLAFFDGRLDPAVVANASGLR